MFSNRLMLRFEVKIASQRAQDSGHPYAVGTIRTVTPGLSSKTAERSLLDRTLPFGEDHS